MGSNAGSPTAEQPAGSPQALQRDGAGDSSALAAPGSPGGDATPPQPAVNTADVRGDGSAAVAPDAAQPSGGSDTHADANAAPATPDAAASQPHENGLTGGAAGCTPDDDELSDLGSVYQGSENGGGGGSVREDDPDAAEPDAQQQLQRALARISQLEDQNVALWQELQNDSGGEASSDGGSPTAGGAEAAAVAAADTARVSDSGGGLTKRISGRFSQEAFAAKEQELSFLQQRCMQFEVEVEQEFEELNEQLFNAQQKMHELQQSLTESEAKRRQMESAKLMVEGKLQETGQQLMECERQLMTANARRAAAAPKDVTNGGASAFATDSPGNETVAESPGTPPESARRSGHPFFNSLLETEVEQLKEENEGIVMELMKNKMALAELSESYARVRRDLHRREAKDRAVSSKMSRMHAILGGDPNRSLLRSGSSIKARA